jgi:hypothetical protein
LKNSTLLIEALEAAVALAASEMVAAAGTGRRSRAT